MIPDTFISIIAIAALVSGIVGIFFLIHLALDRAFLKMRSGYGIVIKKYFPHPEASVTVKFSLRPSGYEKLVISIIGKTGTLAVKTEMAQEIRVSHRILVRYSVGRLSQKLFIHEIREDTP